jgi:hypothetical protein
MSVGWIPMEMANILHGDPASPTVADELVLMLFLSEKGNQGVVPSRTDQSMLEPTAGSSRPHQ